jgi:uncharacterized protein (TIGR03118 family)
MTTFPSTSHRLAVLSSAIAAIFALASLAAQAAPPNAYNAHNLVSNGKVMADHVDPNLVNPWGIAFNPTAFAWVADNGTGVSTLYDGDGNAQSLVVAIPGPDGGSGTPDGIVYSGSATDFMVSNGTASGPARFIFSTEDGQVCGWAPNVDLHNAICPVSPPDTVYKGLALATAADGTERLYVTDFHNAKIDVYDATFTKITTMGSFTDPKMPAHFGPFGIAALNGKIYVSYTKQDAAAHDDVPGRGIVDIYDTEGNFMSRGAAQAGLNSPWGMVIAPSDFGHFSGRLLVSNFGDGTISAYDVNGGNFLGLLRNADGTKFLRKGLWGIQFGNDWDNQPHNTLFFTAGPQHEANGVYGRIDVATPAP